VARVSSGSVGEVVAALNVPPLVGGGLERSGVVTAGKPQVVLAENVRSGVRLGRLGVLPQGLLPTLGPAAPVGERRHVVAVDVGVLSVGVGVGVVRKLARQQLLLRRVGVLLVVGGVPATVDPEARVLGRVGGPQDGAGAVLEVAVEVVRGAGGEVAAGFVLHRPLTFVEDDAGEGDENEGQRPHDGDDPGDGGPVVAVVRGRQGAVVDVVGLMETSKNFVVFVIDRKASASVPDKFSEGESNVCQ